MWRTVSHALHIANAHLSLIQFARDHRMLVEPACGAALAVLYSDRLRNHYFSPNLADHSNGPVVIEICGGSGITIDLLKEWENNLL
jgi:L-serine/L-threonine ammonia-lyase